MWFLLYIFICVMGYKTYRVIKRLTYHISSNEMLDQVAIVVYGHDGIGFEAALDLARRGAKVILACRYDDGGEEVRDNIIESTGNDNVIVKYMDLENLETVTDFATDILETESKVNILINNPGAPVLDNSVTCDELPAEIQVCHFAPFLLTMKLLPLLKSSRPCRIINISSLLHWLGKFESKDIDHLSKHYVEYSKRITNFNLVTVMFTKKLSKLLEGTGVTVNCLYRGLIETDVYPSVDIFSSVIQKLFAATAEEGAKTTIHLATAPELATVTGKYFKNCAETKPFYRSQDANDANLLWHMSNLILADKLQG